MLIGFIMACNLGTGVTFCASLTHTHSKNSRFLEDLGKAVRALDLSPQGLNKLGYVLSRLV